MRLQADKIHNIADLVIWKRHIADSHALQYPMYSARTHRLLAGDSVIVTLFSCNRIAAFHRDTGAPLWNIDLDFLTGSYVDFAAGRYVCAILEDLPAEQRFKDELRAVRNKELSRRMEIIDNSSTTSLASLLPDGVKWRLNYPLYSNVHVRWDDPTRLIIEATNHGIGFIDPESGARQALIEAEKQDCPGNVYFSPPAASEGRLDALTSQGNLYCLRWPVPSP